MCQFDVCFVGLFHLLTRRHYGHIVTLNKLNLHRTNVFFIKSKTNHILRVCCVYV